MRPLTGGDALTGPSRKSSFVDNQATTPLAGPRHAPMTYFLANEGSMQQSSLTSRPESRDKQPDFGVESLEETIGGASGETRGHEAEEEKDMDVGEYSDNKAKSEGMKTDLFLSDQPVSASSTRDPSPHHRRSSHVTTSQPLTPLFPASPAPGSSLPSSPKSTSTKSFRHSDEESNVDDSASQAIISSGDEEGDLVSEIQDTAPQLIMPSIKMPSRRPFTERGKNMGNLKVLIAGEHGVGKTSLIKSIVQTCEDIVHVDPLATSPPSLDVPKSKKSRSKSTEVEANKTKKITEVYASTKAYPPWWSEFEESKVLRRRRSMGDTVLERNLCFVDTPGFTTDVNNEPVIAYVVAQLQRTASFHNLSDSDTLSLLGGSGGVFVDVIFYVFQDKVKFQDLDILSRLQRFTNIVPVLAKADTLTADDIASIKSASLNKLLAADIRPFLLGRPFEDAVRYTRDAPPFAISSATASDAENMDASLLMSPDYVQPLIPSELGILVDQIFNRDTVAWLRHSAAKKFIHWRNSAVPSLSSHIPFGISSPGSSSVSPSSSSVLGDPSSQVLVSYAGNSSYALARLADHQHREERLAQVRLAKWAGDLQRSLQNERERFEALTRGDRAIWLTERLGECVLDGTLIPASVGQNMALTRQPPRGASISSTKAGLNDDSRKGVAILNPRDPLGLLHWNERIKKQGWMTFQVLGSFGVIGALAVWFAKSRGVHGEVLGNWNWNWNWNWWGGGE
ncbi:MAG: hypothetical protein M1827_000960 [Pycnora praestabilis]|nr:MAG: hypothetical protein M1827_000960 [Pycnora praestabilis]